MNGPMSCARDGVEALTLSTQKLDGQHNYFEWRRRVLGLANPILELRQIHWFPKP